jgi:hypothetical protein
MHLLCSSLTAICMFRLLRAAKNRETMVGHCDGSKAGSRSLSDIDDKNLMDGKTLLSEASNSCIGITTYT